MREIKFRGKSKHDGEWVYGCLLDTGNQTPVIVDCCDRKICEVIPDTVGQYTGLEDSSNIMRIYEGDILKDPEYGTTVIVEWQGDGFIARYKNGVEIALANINEYYDVIGNIHDERPVEG